MFKDTNFAKLTTANLGLFNQCFHRLVAWSYYVGFFFKNQVLIIGKNNLPPRSLGSYIVAATHSSTLDPPIVSSATGRPVAYMSKKELFIPWIKGMGYRLVGAFSVNRDKLEMATIRTSKVVLESGDWLLGIFPEGTRSKDGQVHQPKKGVAFLAKTCNKPILPVGISWIPRENKKHPQLVVQIGELIPVSPDSDLEALTQLVQERLNTLQVQTEST